MEVSIDKEIIISAIAANYNISEIKNHCDCEIISLGKKMIAEGKNGKNNKD